MSRVLVVTNDFPTRRGGIESFVFALCSRLPTDEVVVYTASMPGGEEFDAQLPFPVVRDPSTMLLPTPVVSRRVQRTFRRFGCERVMFGAAAPLGLLAPVLRASGARRIVALTHGHEAWWARVPGPRQALRRIGESCDVLTYVSEFCRSQIAPGLSAAAASRMVRLSPGVDTSRFRPDSGGEKVRERLGIGTGDLIVVCAARMVARKGQDTLIRAWPRVREAVPSARLLLVGDGPMRGRLESAARPLGDAVVFGGSVGWDEMPAHLDAADVFAMPTRTRLGGLEPEALGIVCLEAAACELPVVVGDSGGAPETVRHGVTGCVVDPYNPVAIVPSVTSLLQDESRRRTFGTAGRHWVESAWTWDAGAETLRRLLD